MANGFEWTALGDGRYRLTGQLGFETVPAILEQSRAAFGRDQHIEIDLSGIESSDSAGLALLIEWIRLCRARSVPIGYTGVPGQLLALARISDLEGLFGDANDTGAAGRQKSSSVSSSSSHSSSSSSSSSGGSPS